MEIQGSSRSVVRSDNANRAVWFTPRELRRNDHLVSAVSRPRWRQTCPSDIVLRAGVAQTQSATFPGGC